MYNFTPAGGALVRLSDFYGSVVALRPLSIVDSMDFKFEDGASRTVRGVPRVELITVSEEGHVARQGNTLVLPKGIAQTVREAFAANQTLVGRLVSGEHPTNPEWSLVTLEDLTSEEAQTVFPALQAWANQTTEEVVPEGVPF